MTSPRLFGRDSEAALIRTFIDEVSARSASGLLFIEGPSGYGKTALWNAALSSVASDGVFVLTARSQQSQKRVGAATLRTLLSESASFRELNERYASGLECGLKHDSPTGILREAFVGFVEGLLADRACILGIDDTQWLDMESAKALSELLKKATRFSLIVVASGREERPHVLHSPTTLTVSLTRLGCAAATEFVADALPSTPAEVASAIVSRSNGVPFDLVALAKQARADDARTAESVHDSARAAYRVAIACLTRRHRRVLQACSIIGGQLDLRLLKMLDTSESSLNEVLALTGDRFVCVVEGRLTFVHDLVEEAVRATIQNQYELRRKLLAAYQRLSNLTIQDYAKIVDLAVAVGDIEIEFAYLTKLASASYVQGAYEVCVRAFSRAFSISSPPFSAYSKLYGEYSMALRLLGRWREAREVSRIGVERGLELGIPGLGPLAAGWLWAIKMDSDREAARIEYERLIGVVESSERQDVLAMGLLLASEAQDVLGFEEIKDRLGDPSILSNYAATQCYIAEATLMGRLGHYSEAWRAIRAAQNYVDPSRPVQWFSVQCFSKQIQVRESGCAGFQILPSDDYTSEKRDAARLPDGALVCLLEVAAHVDMARGQWAEAAAKVNALHLRSFGAAVGRTQLLSVLAAVATMSGEELGDLTLIEEDIAHCYGHGLLTRAIPLAYWWGAYLAATDVDRANSIVEPVKRFVDYTVDSSTFFIPLGQVLYASRVRDESLLRRIADAPTREHAPWHAAHERLARGYARLSLGQTTMGQADLAASHSKFKALRAPFYAAFAAFANDVASPQEQQLIAESALRNARIGDLGALPASIGRATRPALTFREQQVAELISQGLSNRETAERLIISERTVEVHLSNIFGKLELSSRTQLVRWSLALSSST